ncbi:MAG: hypothetical protein KJO43_14370, partial [Phycisphaerae bacterium]|nr:hypothetical protein [Phycisphaerae bacterium]NNF42234.1 hypothetical protein [Phycisphaerales bacterium]
MKYAIVLTCGAALALAGCSSTATSERGVDHSVAWGELGPPAHAAPQSDVFYLGAGDALGQEIFATYVASLRSTEGGDYYATGASDFMPEN